MRFGICASVQVAAQLPQVSFDYLEEGVQRFLVPERPQEEFEVLLKAARQLPVPVEAANAFFPGDLLLIASPQQQVDRVRVHNYVRTALRRAEQAGVRIIVFGSGTARACPPDCSHDEAVRQIGEHLATWSEWAGEHGVEIVLEPLRYEETNILNTVAESGDVIARVGAPHARLLADTYHMAHNQEDPESVRPYVPLISHVHVAELERRSAPGSNGQDFRPYFAPLRSSGYDRRISIECRWDDLPAQVDQAIATLRQQWASCLESK